MYIRFETDIYFQGTRHKKGIFAAIGDLKRMKKMTAKEKAWYEKTADWFNKNLPNPSCFDQPVSEAIRFRAKSWFVLSQSDFLSSSKTVAALLEKYGIRVKKLLSENPGTIIYEDQFQVVALPINAKAELGKPRK